MHHLDTTLGQMQNTDGKKEGTNRMVSTEAVEDVPQIFCIPIRGSKRLQFTVLAAGALVCGVGLSTVQESVFRVPGFSYGGWMTFLTYVCWTLCGMLERASTGYPERIGKLKHYAIVSVVAMSGVYFTNWALNYVNYATRIIVKSCKVIPVMVLRVVVQRKSHSVYEYCAASVLVVGISLFTLGDKQGYPNFNVLGLGLIGIALVCDALTSNLEEQWFFGMDPKCTHSEVVYHLSVFSAIYGFAVVVLTGELVPAVKHSMHYMQVVPLVFGFSILGYLGVEFVLLLIKHFGATNAEIVKSLRRVLQVLLSFMLFPKPLTLNHGLGFIAVLLGLFWFQHMRPKSTTVPRKSSGNTIEEEETRVLIPDNKKNGGQP